MPNKKVTKEVGWGSEGSADYWCGTNKQDVYDSLPGAFLSCFAKKGSKESAWGRFERIAPAIRATSPDPTRHALSVVHRAL